MKKIFFDRLSVLTIVAACGITMMPASVMANDCETLEKAAKKYWSTCDPMEADIKKYAQQKDKADKEKDSGNYAEAARIMGTASGLSARIKKLAPKCDKLLKKANKIRDSIDRPEDCDK
ncbi:hypothetical protein QUF61_06000 [Candidatus Venteria ishoeyi]|uniref:hypothetical protein n=1 Tax=Candidatus Venteria ishoeyi TaxID=1899563 RepID=UPI0025A5227A|nr:hypothetical protein [Candidatus Venteria ishoeyi]MDM8546027.1 hypothetical protein [Candidatus Venteria ishoeyi]